MLLDYEIDSPFIILNCNDVFRNLSLEDDFRSLKFGARLLNIIQNYLFTYFFVVQTTLGPDSFPYTEDHPRFIS